MFPSTHAVASAALVVAGCAQNSQSPSTTALIATVNPPAVVSAVAAPAVASPSSPDAPTLLAADDAGTGTTPSRSGVVSSQFRTCQADADCVAVPRAGCCHNGWKEAVAVSQTDAYEKANACAKSPRPVCPMYIVRDARFARCEPQSHLCTMVRP
jgi:hypothetical protein